MVAHTCSQASLWLTAVQDIYVHGSSGARCVVNSQMHCTELYYLYTCFIAEGLFHQLTREKSAFCLRCLGVETKGLIDVQSRKSLQRSFVLSLLLFHSFCLVQFYAWFVVDLIVCWYLCNIFFVLSSASWIIHVFCLEVHPHGNSDSHTYRRAGVQSENTRLLLRGDKLHKV